MLTRRGEFKFAAKLFPKRIAHPFPNPHRPIALHIGMPTHRTRTGAGASDVSSEQKEIHDLLDGGDGVLVLRQSHCPTTNNAFATHRDFCRSSNLFARQPARFQNLIPGRRAHLRGKCFEAGRELFDELSI